MPASSLRAASWLTGFIAALVVVSVAHADIYTWTDANGKINVSNLVPPDGVKVTKVVKEQPRSAAEIAAEAQRQQMAMLAERVRQLESELVARDPPAPPAPIVVAPVIVTQPAAAPEPYYPPEQPAYTGCDPSWFGCSYFGPTWWYPVAVAPIKPGRHFHRFDKITQLPVRPVGFNQKPGIPPGFNRPPSPPARRNR
jgi:hypothetical protein